MIVSVAGGKGGTGRTLAATSLTLARKDGEEPKTRYTALLPFLKSPVSKNYVMKRKNILPEVKRPE